MPMITARRGIVYPSTQWLSDTDTAANFKDVFAGAVVWASGGKHSRHQRRRSSRSKDMQAPKLLPWIARNAGIDDALALKLWRRAAGESEELCGSCQSADYFSATMMRFLDLVEQESGKQSPKTLSAGLETAWIWRHQKRLALLNKIATQSLGQLWQANRKHFLIPLDAFAWPPGQLTSKHRPATRPIQDATH